MTLAELPPDDYTRDNWRDHAACKGLDPDLFFPPVGANAHEPKRVCRTCPVADYCLDYALAVNPRDDLGIWGATSQQERIRVRKLRGTTPTVSTGRKEPTRPPAACGTNSGYQRHRRNGEEACPECLQAMAAYDRQRKHARKAER